MTYNPNIPQSTDNLSTSQGQILNNFGQLDTIFDADHFKFDYSTAADRGLHRQVTYPSALAVDPTLLTGGVTYTKNVSAVPQLFFTNSSAQVTQLTGLPLLAASIGSMTLPSGIIIKWGATAVSSQNGNNQVLFTTGGGTNFPSNLFNVQICGSRNASASTNAMYVNSAATFDKTQFNVTCVNASGAWVNIYWMAIGN